MVQFKVSTDSLGYTAGSMSAALAQFDAQVAAVTATVNGVAGGSWKGDASDEFLAAWQQWLASAQITRAALTAIVTKLHSGETTYENTEAAIVRQNRSSNVTATAVSSGAVKK
ncbi:WXG100 family type VII secretion target [Salinibacterium sp. ZJ77]|uniref:WXG100 family type VII secretion target n=1 Tax=Salinibacterium sp. ZJ77 TaxID=2708337 RepID=UPI00141ECCB7|nr:WXG100 family type VII secretion target [Salinibacterium sp. ZJ77]